MSSLWFLVVGFIICSLSAHFLLPIFLCFGLRDYPERYPHERGRAPLPYPSGLIPAVLSFGIFIIAPSLWLLSVPLFIVIIVSLIDDIHRVSPLVRLGIQIFVALMAVLLGAQIDFIGHPFQPTNIALFHYPLLMHAVSVAWIILIMNALNFIDGSRGMSSNISAVGFFTFGLLGLVRPELLYDPNYTEITHINLYLSGVSLGIVPFVMRRKSIIGDTGSQVLGYLLGVMSIIAGAKIATTIIVLSLPIVDAGVVILRRILHKKAPWKWDLTHIHHNLEQFVPPEKISLLFTIVSLIMGLVAVFVVSPVVQLVTLIMILMVTGGGVIWLGLRK